MAGPIPRGTGMNGLAMNAQHTVRLYLMAAARDALRIHDYVFLKRAVAMIEQYDENPSIEALAEMEEFRNKLADIPPLKFANCHFYTNNDEVLARLHGGAISIL